MKNYKLSNRALKEYRSNAKKDKNLAENILEVKLNCLIDASRMTHKKFMKTEHIFGHCIFTTNIFGKITHIRWDNTLQLAQEAELLGLFHRYKQAGLNNKGNRFV